MIPIYKSKCIQIEITNNCNLKCPNCTRFIGHHSKTYYMELGKVKEALQSLERYKGIIGVMGGEPTLHPYFREICLLFQKYVPKEKRGLWTNGARWNEHENVIRETFTLENILYNAHDYEYKGQHQPLLIASKDIIKDEDLRKELINKCWVQERWSPSINPKGAYFCEVAAAMGMLFDIRGWRVEKGWWNKKPKDFQDQVDTFCEMCSACIPFSKEIYESEMEFISISNLEGYIMSKNLGKLPSDIWVGYPFLRYNKRYTREDYKKNVKGWRPGYFRDWEQHEPNKRVYK